MLHYNTLLAQVREFAYNERIRLEWVPLVLFDMNIYNVTTEILIIGGGITGTSTAYYLNQNGHQVTLLERSELASEASGLNAGTLWQIGWGTSPDLSTTLSMGGL